MLLEVTGFAKHCSTKSAVAFSKGGKPLVNLKRLAKS